MTPSRPQPPERLSRAQTIVFVADDARALVWRLGPLIEAFVMARHRVVGIVPLMAKPDNLMLAARGVELRAPEIPRSLLHRLAFQRDDDSFLRDIAPDVVIGLSSPFTLDVVAKVHRLGGATATILSATSDDFIGLDANRTAIAGAPGLRPWQWRKSLQNLSAVIVPTDEDRRRLVAAQQWPARLAVHVAPLPGIQNDCTDRVAVPSPALRPRLLLLPDPDDQRATSALVAAAVRARRSAPELMFDLAAMPSHGAEHDAITTVLDQEALDQALDAALAVVVPMSRNRVPPLTFEALRRGRALVVPATPFGRQLVDEPLNGILVPIAPHHHWQQNWTQAMVKAAGLGHLAAAMARAGAQKAERGFRQASVLAAAAQAFPEALRADLVADPADQRAARASRA